MRYLPAIERLVLMSTTSGGAGGGPFPYHELGDLAPALRARALVELADTHRDAAWQRANFALFDALVVETLTGIELGANETGHERGARHQFEARSRHDAWARVKDLSVPFAVFGGRYDGIAAPEHQRALAARVPSADFQLFDGAISSSCKMRRRICVFVGRC